MGTIKTTILATLAIIITQTFFTILPLTTNGHQILSVISILLLTVSTYYVWGRYVQKTINTTEKKLFLQFLMQFLILVVFFSIIYGATLFFIKKNPFDTRGIILLYVSSTCVIGIAPLVGYVNVAIYVVKTLQASEKGQKIFTPFVALLHDVLTIVVWKIVGLL